MAPDAGSASEEGCVAALAGLHLMGPRRLAAVLTRWGPVEAWAEVRAGRVAADPEVAATMGAKPHELAATWAEAARRVDTDALWAAHRRMGVQVVRRGTPRYPAALAADLEPPEVVFVRGDLARLAGPRVGIVGTRRATATGRQVAAELGEELAHAGVGVVSGLALGIDGAAHQGVVRAGRTGARGAPIGVVGTGLDVVYPRRHRDLWDAVAEHGVLLSEVPLGGEGARWRFPARNRLIAALSDVLVVVESHATGGALLTVDEAQERGVPVMAVPGSVRNPAAAGTNELLQSGAELVTCADDVLSALDLSACDRLDPRLDPVVGHADRVDGADGDAELDVADLRLLEVLGWDPVGLDRLAAASGLGLGDLSVRLARLEATGRIARNGGTIERTSPR